ncbi:MAG TPA: hypothetical protein VMF51_13305 [Nocardioides sp.]|uniref:hypothetical protein n=1 Tax=Nocardioides sp. TaxID=35761 RepID=UPI002D1089C5|nr:hypothetical protein [Nocardioides sp.]HTW16106.1 hypothetical protein [Nocardioides sp.]
MSQSTFATPEPEVRPSDRRESENDTPRAPVPLPVHRPADDSVTSSDTGPLRRKVGDAVTVGDPDHRQRLTTNVTFGLSGRSAEHIRTAIAQGYRTFDGADTYGDTITLLAAEIDRAVGGGSGLTRDDFDIVYKVLGTEPDQVGVHVTKVAKLFGGRVDHLLIHQTTDARRAGDYLPHLLELRRTGVATHLGAGDVTAGNVAGFEHLDCFEVSADALLLAAGSDPLAAELKRIGKPVLVYNLMHAAQSLYADVAQPALTAEHLAALLALIKQRVPTAEPIVSSSDPRRSELNLGINDPDRDDDFDVLGDVSGRVDRRLKQLAQFSEIAQMPDDVKRRVKELLAKHSDTDWYESADGIAGELAAALKTFSDTELDVSYRNPEGKNQVHTLRVWITMLHATQNCDVAPAHECLTNVMWS